MRAREFQPEVMRTGAQTRNTFTLRCSDPHDAGCRGVGTYESYKPMPDEVVRKKFSKDQGWLVGRDRRHDVCPNCISTHRMASGARVTIGGERVPSLEELNEQEARISKARQKAEDELRAVTRQPEPPSPVMIAPAPVPEPSSFMAIMQEVLREMRDIKAAVELLIENAARPTPAPVVRTRTPRVGPAPLLTDFVLRQLEGGERSYAEMAAEASAAGMNPNSVSATLSEMLARGEIERPLRGVYRRVARKVEAEPAPSLSPADGSIRSYKYPNKRYSLTSITVPRSAWAKAGFSPGERFDIRVVGGVVLIMPDPHGVLVKKVNSVSVHFQTSALSSPPTGAMVVDPAPGRIMMTPA